MVLEAVWPIKLILVVNHEFPELWSVHQSRYYFYNFMHSPCNTFITIQHLQNPPLPIYKIFNC